MTGLPSLQLINGRWRGIMPFRQAKLDRKHLDSERRTGEPSLSSVWEYPEGYGKAKGSYKQAMRMALQEWMKAKFGSYSMPLTFEYKLYRKRNIVVTGTFPYIKHIPSYGRGKKGFILQMTVQFIDGIPYKGFGSRVWFAWDRIIGREKLLTLSSPKLELETT